MGHRRPHYLRVFFVFIVLLNSCWLESTLAFSLPSQTSIPSATDEVGASLLTAAEKEEVGPLNCTPRRSVASFVANTILYAAGISLLPAQAVAVDSQSPQKLTFQTLDSGVRIADILAGNSAQGVVTPTSKVNIHITGRLLGKQGWIFEDSQAAGEDPFRLDLGTGTVISGLEEGLVGMKPGGRRRIVVPSKVGYTSRQLEPIPRDFGNRQRLYTTVMNTVRIDREREALGADLAGVVVLDVELLRLRN